MEKSFSMLRFNKLNFSKGRSDLIDLMYCAVKLRVMKMLFIFTEEWVA